MLNANKETIAMIITIIATEKYIYTIYFHIGYGQPTIRQTD